jgi:hypothetical protein
MYSCNYIPLRSELEGPSILSWFGFAADRMRSKDLVGSY